MADCFSHARASPSRRRCAGGGGGQIDHLADDTKAKYKFVIGTNTKNITIQATADSKAVRKKTSPDKGRGKAIEEEAGSDEDTDAEREEEEDAMDDAEEGEDVVPEPPTPPPVVTYIAATKETESETDPPCPDPWDMVW